MAILPIIGIHPSFGICQTINKGPEGMFFRNREGILIDIEKSINYNEANILFKDFIKRKPKWYNSKFWWNKSFNKFDSDKYPFENGYWWSLNKKGNIQRKLFIESIIKKLK